MDIKKIDKNFDTSFECPKDVEWHSVSDFPFSIHGITYSEEEGLFRRLPKEVADATNVGVSFLSKNTAGGRVRFCTNSPYIIVRVEENFAVPFSHMTIAGKYGVSLFVNDKFSGTVMPSYEQFVNSKGSILFDGIKYITGERDLYLAEIFMPLYSEVKSVHIGIQAGSVLQKARDYKHAKPILFYGSSITQGACACKPGDDYVNRLCRMLDSDILNLGFSGSALGESVIADYIASCDPSVFVIDYDHNAPNAEHLQNTHFALYQKIRNAHPNTPIIMMTMPTIEGYENREWNKPRREVIFSSYSRARTAGDNNVYLIDCYGCFGSLESGECGTVDDCHPNSLGFLRMAERVYPVLDKILNNK